MPRAARHRLPLAIAASLALTSGAQRAARAVEISARGPVPCNLGEKLPEALRERVGELSSAAPGTKLLVQTRPGGKVRLDLTDAAGASLFRRDIDPRGSSCESLANSLALLASLWIRSEPAAATAHHRRNRPAVADAGEPSVDAGAPSSADGGTTSVDAGEPSSADAGMALRAADAGAEDAGAAPDLDAGTDAGAPAPLDAGIANADAGVPLATTAATPPAAQPLFPRYGAGGGIYAASSLGASGLWIPTWFGGEAELVGLPVTVRVLAARAHTLSRSAGSGSVHLDDLFLGVRARSELGSSSFALEGGLRLDRLSIESSGYAENLSLSLWDPGADFGPRWRHSVGPACWIDLGAMATGRAHRRAFTVEGLGTVLDLPALWLSAEALAGCRIF